MELHRDGSGGVQEGLPRSLEMEEEKTSWRGKRRDNGRLESRSGTGKKGVYLFSSSRP